MAQDNAWWKQGANPVESSSPDGEWWKKGVEPVPSEAKPRSIGAAINDTVIEVANAAAGGASSAANFLFPGNAFSKFVDKNIVEDGESKQSDLVKAEKQKFRTEMENAKGVGDEVAAIGNYVVNTPALAGGQAVGSFVVPGAAVKGGGALARGLGAGANAVTRAGQGRLAEL